MKVLRLYVAALAALLFATSALAQGGVQNGGTAGRVDTAAIIGGAVNPTKLSDGLLEGKYVFCRMDSQPSVSAPNGYGDPTGTAGDINRVQFACGLSASYDVLGAGQTLLAPLLDTSGKGLDISQDQTDNDGVEYVFGALNTYGAFTKTVGTDAGFCFRVKATIADVSGTDDFDIGWRKNESFQAAIDNYDEGAWVNINLGTLQTETILNNAATVTTTPTLPTGLTAWADNATHTVEVCVKGRAASYYYDGVRVQRTVAYNFDSGEVVVPFIYFLQATTSPGKIWLKEVEIYDTVEASPTGTIP